VDGVEALLRERVGTTRTKHRIPSLGAAIVTADDGGDPPAWVEGTRIRGREDPATTDDRWHIGSCAKAMTAALYARLVERGRASWDATLPELFPDLEPIDPGWRGTPIDRVLTHRAGLAANLDRADLDAWFDDARPIGDQRSDAAMRALSPPPRKPGSFRYSNLGYIVAGAAIERIVGGSWEEAVTEEVLSPLGITSAGFGAPTGNQPWGHRARWLRMGAGAPVDPGSAATPNVRADNPPVMGPAGRIHLALADWARFIRVFLADGGELLSHASISKLTTPPGGRGQQQGMGWAAPPGRLAQDVALGQQGSNTAWVATALIASTWDRAALVVCNDGRGRMLAVTGQLGIALLGQRDRRG
jgi:CubicO group peptidase (beta-lactamase class C family)